MTPSSSENGERATRTASAFGALVGRELRYLLRDSKFAYMAPVVPLTAFVMLQPPPLFWLRREWLLPFFPAVAILIWAPNQFGLDGPGFARLAMAPQPARLVILAKQTVLGGTYLAQSLVIASLCLWLGLLRGPEAVLAMGLATGALFFALAVGTVTSCLFPWPLSFQLGPNMGVWNAWVGQLVTCAAVMVPGGSLYAASRWRDPLGSELSWAVCLGVLCCGFVTWLLTVHMAARFVPRSAYAILSKLLP